ncbi:hypothetical protein DL766_000952 [Monosporascus sp. MC13-8B]|uniref:Uncharacterized protein n=1 Tax=Monosporascus cannonballus TaxID=155416 RepID=A0ABY0GXV0_9PEZI|nr:hypothetical protein DL762_007940 [Monosporascus cannonballus]RYP00719.1 hypothetical protein DL763_000599 [Monosporascus cannonballus]RYP38535.1 hypothetical protein DL766_000952 [Monosporascus sp. MC13-8B]
MPARPRSSPVTQGRINGVTIYRVDHPETGCSAGFWATRVASPSSSSSAAALPGETRIELDFQHASPGCCGCVGRDANAPAVRALLEAALSLSRDGARGAVAPAMLAFLRRVLRLPALGDAELDLWDELHWPRSEGDDGKYGEYDEDAAVEVSRPGVPKSVRPHTGAGGYQGLRGGGGGAAWREGTEGEGRKGEEQRRRKTLSARRRGALGLGVSTLRRLFGLLR